MKISLTPAQHADLTSLASHTKSLLVYKRCQVVLNLARGIAPHEVARIMGCSLASLYRWEGRFERDGICGLAREGERGRPQCLPPVARDVIQAYMRNAELCGSGPSNSRTTVPAIQRHLNALGINASQPTIRRTIHALGWRWRTDQFVLVHQPQRITLVDHDSASLLGDV